VSCRPRLTDMSVRMRTRILLTFVFTLPACSGSVSSGVDAKPTVTATVEARIGLVDGPEEYVFGAVTGIAADTQHIFIADQQADVIRAYDWDGVFAYTVASRGSGPGELRRPCCLAIDSVGHLWVRDAGNARYNAYRIGESAEFLRSVHMVHTSAGYYVAPSFGPGGTLIDVGHVLEEDGEMVLTRNVLAGDGGLVRREVIPDPPTDSVPQHTVARDVPGGTSRLYFQQPFGPAHLVAHGPHGSYATAVSSVYRIHWVGPAASWDTVLAAEFPGAEVTPAERDSARATWSEQLAFADLTPGDMPFDVARVKPVLRFIQFDAVGRLWVHLMPDRASPHVARVHDRSGEVVAVVAWPREVDLRYGYLLDRAAFGVARDSLGVQQVVRLAF